MSPYRAADYKAAGGKLIRIRLTEDGGRIVTVQISGDFFLVPEETLPVLEQMLAGVLLKEPEVSEKIDDFLATTQAKSVGISATDLVKALMSTREEITAT